MRISSVILLVLTISLLSVGCAKVTKHEVAVSDEQTKTEIHDAVVKFLTALKSGKETDIFAMMTPLARKVCGEDDIVAGLPASDTAGFTIDEIKILSQDQAQVRTTMVDIDHRGNKMEDPLGWAMRKTEEGWRIAGTAFILFEGMEPIVINFESPQEIEKAKALAETQAKKFEEEMMQMHVERDNLQPTTISPNETLGEVQVGTTRTDLPGN